MVRNPAYGRPGPEAQGNIDRHLYYDHDLGAEKQVRKRFEKWRVFTTVDKASDADFVFLVHVDSNAWEGVALPLEAYRQFRDELANDPKFDFETVREEAYGRYLVGPLRLATVGRMSERLVEDFHGRIAKSHKPADK